MLAITGVVLAVIAAALKLARQYQGAITWLVIAAVILIGIEAALFWHRGGRYARRGAA